MSVGGSEEPLMVTLRRTKEGRMQILSWFAKVFTAGSDKVVGAPGLQTEAEDYESAFLRRTRRRGWRRATFQIGRGVIAMAVEGVRL